MMQPPGGGAPRPRIMENASDVVWSARSTGANKTRLHRRDARSALLVATRNSNLPAGDALRPGHLGDHKRELERLAGVQPRIDHGVVAQRQRLVRDGLGAAGAFGDVLTGHLDVHAARMGSLGPVHLEELTHLGQDPIERPGLVAGTRGDGVAMHRIAYPDHGPPLLAHPAQQRRQLVRDLVRPHAHDQRQPPCLVIRVQDINQPDQVIGLERWTALQAQRVLHPAQKLDMRAVDLPRAVANPQQMGRHVVPVPRRRVDPRQRLLIGQQQRLVTGEEVRRLPGGATRGHEFQRFVDPASEGFVTFRRGRQRDEAEVPLIQLAQVGVATLGERAQQIEGRRRLIIGLDHAGRVGRARHLVEIGRVDDVATIARQRDATQRLNVGGARFGELPGHAADLDHRPAAAESQDHRHLQQHAEGVADLVRMKLGEAFGAVAALQQKCLALGDPAKRRLERSRLVREHQRRIFRQGLLSRGQLRRIGIMGHLPHGHPAPGRGTPAGRDIRFVRREQVGRANIRPMVKDGHPQPHIVHLTGSFSLT